MKKIYSYIIFGTLLLIGSCAKDGLWNQEGGVPDSQMGTVVGELLDVDTGQPLRGVKILIERQTSARGANTFVDTVSTDSEGKFTYKVPFPNKLTLSVHDLGRYTSDVAQVEVTEHKEYPVLLKSEPLYGVTSIVVSLFDEDDQPAEDIRVGLFVRGDEDETYSEAEVLSSDAEGQITFEDIAFPVHYKVELMEDPLDYEPALAEGKLETRNPVNVSLPVVVFYPVGDILFESSHFIHGRPVKGEHFSYRYKSARDDDFGAWTEAVFDADGRFVLQGTIYPGEIQIESNSQSKVRFVVEDPTLLVTPDHITTPLEITIKDLDPRYVNPVLTNLRVSTLVLNNDVALKSPFDLTMDGERNLYITDSPGNRVVMVDSEGNASTVATGLNWPWGIAADSSGVIYVANAENVAGAHKISKIEKNGSGQYTVSTIAGTGSSGGTNGIGSDAQFNRPSGVIFDKTRNCLYISEWATQRLRKIDLSTSDYTVSTLATTGMNSNLFTMALSPDYNDLYISSNIGTTIYKYSFVTNSAAAYENSGVNNRGLFVTADNKLLATAGNHHLVFYYDLANDQMTELSNRTAGVLTGGQADTPPITDIPITDAVANFNQPFGIYYDIWTGNWYVANSTNNAGSLTGNTGSVRIIRSDDI